ncbi:phage tail-collar fiber domain-containing protein [Lelliottia amnigena]|uniref:phage tail-collar fiber domain-containing protein n=1 Tax=Lelliottia amnigena TaxID=61646 RepID=UPI0021DA1DB8|nr:phage tail protein [Lelliottia amnigena]MCU7782233.1 phage tail protein [Lelliottia amnigena]
MSQAVITKVFTEWKAQQAINNQPVTLDEFIFAYIPGLDPEKPISNTEAIPAADKIVHRQAVSKSGVVNGHSVVYSVTLGADVGDFNFNWIGLVNKATSTLAMIIHAPTQSKIKNASGQQGNVLVRSMLMEYSGAQAATQITTPAETWQIDFTARLAAMDERQRLENIDLYGAAAFFDTGYLVAKTGAQFYVTKGAGYVAGLRAELAANQNITVSTKPIKVWLDVSWSGTLTSVWAVQSKITVAANLANYAESGVQHFVFALASIDASGNITDLRPKGTLNEQAANDALKAHEKSRNHPDATTKEKGFVQLSSETGSDDESKAATPKAVKTVNDDLTKVKEGLRTASKADVVTSDVDVTGGRVPVVGWQGLGAATQFRMGVVSQFFAYAGASDEVPLHGAGWQSSYAPARRAQAYVAADSRFYSRFSISETVLDAETPWARHYTTLHKPAATDVDAVSASQGGTFAKSVTFNQGLTSKGRIAWGDYSSAVGSTTYNGMVNVYDSNGKMRWAFGPYQNGWSIYNYDAAGGYVGNLLNIDYTSKQAAFAGTVFSSSEFQSNYANSYRIAYGNYGVFWRNDGSNHYLMLTNSGDSYGAYSSARPFTVNLATGRVNIGHGLNVSGQALPSDYANFDARYQAKGSYAAPNAASRGANGWFQDASTGLIYQWCQGATVNNEANHTVTFPKAFPSACLFASVSTLNVSNNDNAEQHYHLVSKTTANCVVKPNRAYGSNGNVAPLIWAVGY